VASLWTTRRRQESALWRLGDRDLGDVAWQLGFGLRFDRHDRLQKEGRAWGPSLLRDVSGLPGERRVRDSQRPAVSQEAYQAALLRIGVLPVARRPVVTTMTLNTMPVVVPLAVKSTRRKSPPPV